MNGIYSVEPISMTTCWYAVACFLKLGSANSSRTVTTSNLDCYCYTSAMPLPMAPTRNTSRHICLSINAYIALFSWNYRLGTCHSTGSSSSWKNNFRDSAIMSIGTSRSPEVYHFEINPVDPVIPQLPNPVRPLLFADHSIHSSYNREKPKHKHPPVS